MSASSVALADTYATEEYDVSDNRAYSGEGDWDVGYTKAECASFSRMGGVSGSSDASNSIDGAFGFSALCDSGSVYTDVATYHTHSLAGFDDRGDTSTGDWDVNLTKGECASNEVLAGISQAYGLVHKILCRAIECNGSTRYSNDAGSCNVVMFSTRDNRLSQSDGDWATGYMKNQCGDSQLLKGVSVNSDGTIHALLCCNATATSCF